VSALVLLPEMLRIGGGAVAALPEVLSAVGIRRPLLVTDPFLANSPLLASATQPLNAAGIEFDLFADTVSDPTTGVIEDGVRRLQASGADGLVAFGGGSPIDTAKAIAVLAANGGNLRDYKVPNPIAKAGPPVIAIPTTAGTGSEVTRFTVITDTATDEKMLIAGPHLVPRAAIVDYRLSLTCPLRLTADTGLDSLTHAIEAYVSRRANPFSDAQAVIAMGKIQRNIRTVCTEPGNEAARAEMMLAATLAGLAFSNASVALVHGMSRPIGAFFHVPHGLSNAMLLPAVTEFSLRSATSRYADCARAMGVAEAGASDEAAGVALVTALRQLSADLQVPTPAGYGIDRARWDGLLATMAAQALASGSPGNNPRVPTEAEMVALYRDVWAA
jgi:alcohol dehydrogenase class IV